MDMEIRGYGGIARKNYSGKGKRPTIKQTLELGDMGSFERGVSEGNLVARLRGCGVVVVR